MSQLIGYTDGSVLWNPWPWWWAWVVVDGDTLVVSGSGNVPHATNNQMELQAVIEVLQSYIPKDQAVEYSDAGDLFVPATTSLPIQEIDVAITIVTDSTYVQKWITEWIEIRIRRSRRRSKWGKLVANIDQWKQLHALVQYFTNLKREWTKAHVGTKWNEWVDDEARRRAGE